MKKKTLNGIAWVCAWGCALCFRPAFAMESIASTGTNVNPAIYETLEKQKKVLTNYPILFDASFDVYKSQKDEGTYVVPGLIRTETVDLHNQVDECADMTPQGVAVVDDYIMISAYCHEHKHNSVIYVLNKRSHLFVKTIILENRSHVGGIAYDPICRNLWVATKNEEEGHACVSSLKLATIDSYNFSKTRKPIRFDYVRQLPQMKNNTFMTYYDFEVYCGCFDKKTKTLSLYIYKIEPFSGHIDNRSTRTIRVAGYDFIGDICQGIAISDEYIVLSASNGPDQESMLAFFDRSDDYFLNAKPSKTITLPSRLEQVYFDGGGTLFLLFESAAKAYRQSESIDIDRVLKCDVDTLTRYVRY